MLDFVPDSPPEVDRKIFLKSLKSTPQGASPGCTYEHLRVVLDDPDTWDLLFEAVTSLAQTSVPEEIAVALMGARLTALAKSDGAVRGIATGSSLKRLVARTLAKQFASEFDAECAPFQYARSSRAGTDCVEHMLRAATDLDPNATILSVVWAHTITYRALPCWDDWRPCRECAESRLLCVSIVPILLGTVGGTTRDRNAQLCRR